ncbi:hypothetical protein GBA65_21825 (plasmid) [Rubrobacter marinus]|uniref:Uncharacterized protein n=1 Tax=Rubrobacter marinus TaxID=2653852 RepID=A0A6G8Q3P9_9ACTN|nr:hypothetical protein [Rubrobacter marinus]QIN81079.1 hypothetical protein GBA65_21825 [Rubrobacter marinus]
MLTITVTRTESYDPLYVIEQATRQAVAQQIAREHADPHDPEALAFRYGKDANSEGDYVDLVISGTDETRVGLVLRRLRAHGYDDLTVEWLAEEDPPHLISVVSSEAGFPAPPARAREVLEALGLHVPLVPDAGEGSYKTLLPDFFPITRSVTVADSEWIVSVLRRR